MRSLSRILILALLAMACIVLSLWPHGMPSAAIAADTRPQVNWLPSLDTAYLQAQKTQVPILVFVESHGDPACAAALDELQTAVYMVPTRWVLARLEVSDARPALAHLGVASVPAIRLLAPDGRLTASLNAPMTGTIADWIETHRVSAVAVGLTNAPTRQELLAALSSADTANREIAIRRLLQEPRAADDVVNLLFNGTMPARLAAIDLLEHWGAPVGEFDPWDRATFTSERHDLLLKWAKAVAASGTTAPSPSTAPSQTTSPLAGLEIELDQLLSAPTEADARSVRERLVRFGEAALPAVYQRLNATPSDSAIQRLTALRYRLVATDRLAAEWPGGFDRLSCPDPFIRRAAADELSRHVGPDDVRLLVELFSDKDEFVRERSLKALSAVGGRRTNQALMKMLQDPEPNVRAAVLKTLAASPDSSLAADLVNYALTEKDADLVVHAIHVLQDIPGDISCNGLATLLSSTQWRVRAEACGAIHQKLQGGETLSAKASASTILALSKCMDDPDTFVQTQAALALTLFHLPASEMAVAKAMGQHPEIALIVLNALEKNPSEAAKMLPAIRKFGDNPNPKLRIAAIRAVCRFAPRHAAAELGSGVKDPDPDVRQAAALGFVVALNAIMPEDGTLFLEPGNYETAQQNIDVKKWLESFRQGIGRPAWMTALKPDFQRLLTDSDEVTRAGASVALCSLGETDQAWAVLLKAGASPISAATAMSALPFVDWDQRQQLFGELIKVIPDGQIYRLISMYNLIPDQREAPAIWALLADPPRDALLLPVNNALIAIYGMNHNGSELSNDVDPTTPEANKVPFKDATAMLTSGGELQKTEALCLIYTISPSAAIAPAKVIYEDAKKSSPAARLDALQILLLAMPDADAHALAASAMNEPTMRRIAVQFLATGADAVSSIRDNIYLSHRFDDMDFNRGGSSQGDPIIHVNVPSGLDIKPLLELLGDSDRDVAGYAGYLVAVLGDHRGLDPLLKAARAHGFEPNWDRLVYRGLTCLDDDSQVPILEELYKKYEKQSHQIRPFYWTIRAMHGPNILKLRKRIRDEVGLNKLQ